MIHATWLFAFVVAVCCAGIVHAAALGALVSAFMLGLHVAQHLAERRRR